LLEALDMKKFILIASLSILSGCDTSEEDWRIDYEKKAYSINRQYLPCEKWFMTRAAMDRCYLEAVNEVDKEITELLNNLKAQKTNAEIGSLEEFKNSVDLDSNIRAYIKQGEAYKNKIKEAAYSDLEQHYENGVVFDYGPFYETNSNTLFNGVIFEHWLRDGEWIVTTIKNGRHTYQEWYYNNGQLKIRRSYKKGIYKEGKWVQDYDRTTFWRNGNLQIISEVRDGKYSNKWFDLYTDGKPISKEEFQELVCSIEGCSD